MDCTFSFHKALKDKINLFQSRNGIYYIVFPETNYPKLKSHILSIKYEWRLFKTKKPMELDDIYEKLNSERLFDIKDFELIDNNR